MFDIIRCNADPSIFGFSKFYSLAEVKGKIVEVENLEAATNYKNKKVLLALRDFAFDEGAIKIIAEKKNVCFLIDLGRLIRTRGVPRAIAISKLRNFLRMCNKFGAFYTFATFAESTVQIRRPEEIENIAILFELNRGQAKFAMKMLQHYL